MREENNILQQVSAAKENSEAADHLVQQYLPFIKSETAKFTHKPPSAQEDEFSIALFAFYESILSYSNQKGSFLHFAAIHIRHRLIDYYRKEKRHSGLISLNMPINSDTDNSRTVMDGIMADYDEMEQVNIRLATKEEIASYSADLSEYGLSLTDIATNSPKQQRTLEACHKALAYAKSHQELLDDMVRTKKLPVSILAEGSGVERKTLERHRKYMVALLLAYTNGFEIIRGHLCQVLPEKGGKNV